MKRIEVSRQVNRSPAVVFAAVRDFSTYPAYSDYLKDVTPDGDGAPGTEYDLAVHVLGLSFDVRTRLDQLEPPRRIEWSVLGDVEAVGRWLVTPVGDETASKIDLVLEYDPNSIDSSVVSLPLGMTFSWLTDRAEALAEREAGAVLDRLVADIEREGVRD
ncbi:MAG: SRPBCC family protein [Halodesulfurarchaeum sp.]|nr:SRPBCC family protein [Halodesulfurarchaeum sp.]